MLVAESVATYQTFTAVPAQNAKEETRSSSMIFPEMLKARLAGHDCVYQQASSSLTAVRELAPAACEAHLRLPAGSTESLSWRQSLDGELVVAGCRRGWVSMRCELAEMLASEMPPPRARAPAPVLAP